jgi:alkanesulfonate monooxygenase SsuD/methylene tetrahydromethanopterin reductase-like flavin-dependent oxidoreductase (luciferase family)
MEPQPARTGGPPLWFGGSSLHPRLIARLVRYGSGFNPLGPAGDLAPLDAAMRAAGRGPGELARGFSTICVKPSQFLDETAGIGAFCRSLAEKAAALSA